jgi:hypothetical protein
MEEDVQGLPHPEFSNDSCLQEDIDALAQISAGQPARPDNASPDSILIEPDIDWGEWVDYLYEARLQPDTIAAWEWLQLATGMISNEGTISDDQAQCVLDRVLRTALKRDANSSLLDNLVNEAVTHLIAATPLQGGRGV